MKKQLTLTVNGTNLSFTIGAQEYDKFINELTPSNKTTPARNLLVRTVDKDSKAALDEMLQQPGAAFVIGQSLAAAYAPEFDIVVGE